MRRPLARAFFARPAEAVAADLVGTLLVRADEGLAARIVEVEAYSEDDPASHAYRGPTLRNAPMFGSAGHAYVYFTYGMHWCMNVSCGQEGRGEAVLLRAAEPLDGVDTMRARRGARRERDLLRGPARLAEAFGLDGTWSGRDLCGEGAAASLHLADDGVRLPVVTGPRVGVVQAADWQRRFAAAGSPWVSAYKRHPKAPPVT